MLALRPGGQVQRGLGPQVRGGTSQGQTRNRDPDRDRDRDRDIDRDIDRDRDGGRANDRDNVCTRGRVGVSIRARNTARAGGSTASWAIRVLLLASWYVTGKDMGSWSLYCKQCHRGGGV